MSKRLRRIAGISVLMGAAMLSQSGIAYASDSETVSTDDSVSAATHKEVKEIDVTKVECPSDDASKITDFTYTINGVGGFKTLEGNVKHGDTVKVDFTLASGCKDVELSLVSYDAPDAVFAENTADQQILFDSKTGKFTEKGSLEIVLPDCFFQVDFARGEVLQKLGPEGSGNFYGDRLIQSGNGGEVCVSPSETPKETPKSEAPAHVESAVLAHTGADMGPTAGLGSALMLMGFGAQRGARRLINNRRARIARNRELLRQAFGLND